MTMSSEARVSMHREDKTTSNLRGYCKAFWLVAQASRPHRRATEDSHRGHRGQKRWDEGLKGFRHIQGIGFARFGVLSRPSYRATLDKVSCAQFAKLVRRAAPLSKLT